jgi:Zn-dependent peptidase ImmA (M78 family)
MFQWSYENAFACALVLSERLRRHTEFPRSIEVITAYVDEHLKRSRDKIIPINFHPRIYEASTFYGTIEDCESQVDIYYDLNRNRCWKRFIITKELCHLVYGGSDNLHLSSSIDQVDSLLSQILAGIEMDQATSIEHAAIVMATEVLLPHCERPNVNKMISGGGDAMTVAKHYQLPAQMVSNYLQGNYAALAEAVAQKLAAKT